MSPSEAFIIIITAAQEAAEILANDIDSEQSDRAAAIYKAIELLTKPGALTEFLTV